jgi:hypothetical protein
MRNLIKIETKAVLNKEAREALEKEVQALRMNVTTHTKLYKIINTCVSAAYKLGKIDAKKEMDI